MAVDDNLKNVRVNYSLPSSNPPTVVVKAGAGAGATASIEGNNRSGIIILTTGSLLSAGGDLLTISLADDMAFPNKMTVVFNTLDETTAGILANIFVSAASTASATLRMKGLTLGAATTYKLSYSITGY